MSPLPPPPPSRNDEPSVYGATNRKEKALKPFLQMMNADELMRTIARLSLPRRILAWSHKRLLAFPCACNPSGLYNLVRLWQVG